MKGLKRGCLTAVMAVALTITGCGTVSDDVRGETILSEEQKESGRPDSQNGDVLPENENSEDLHEKKLIRKRVIPFPFEDSEEYTLYFALQETDEKQGEFQLCDGYGTVLQRIPYGVFESPCYYVLCENDRRNLVFFPGEEETGRLLEWNNGCFAEREIDVRCEDGMLLTKETELYSCHGGISVYPTWY